MMEKNEIQEPQFDVVNNPKHYCSGGVECIEAMEAALGTSAVKFFCIGNAFKYIFRCLRKNGLEDVKKAQWYLNKYIELSDD